MARHRVPVHLETPDKLLFSLTARQTLILALGITLAYMALSALWRYSYLLPFGVVLAVAVCLASLVVAFFKPKRRAMEVWAVVAFNYLLLPKHYAWRPVEPEADGPARRRRGEDEQEQEVS